MTIYACVNTKGGVGKTTSAVHLAATLAKSGSALLIDGDPQNSAAAWAAWRREMNMPYSPTTTCLAGKAILFEGRQLAACYNNVVVDAGGRDSAGLRSALLLADRAIVPVGASGFDSAAMTDLLEVMELSREYNPNLDVRVLLMRIDSRTKDIECMLTFLREQRLNVLKSRICERVAFRRATAKGVTVQEIGTDRAAIEEVESFVAEATA